MLGTSQPTKGPSLVSMFFHLKAFESLKRFSHVKKSNGVQDRFQKSSMSAGQKRTDKNNACTA